MLKKFSLLFCLFLFIFAPRPLFSGGGKENTFNPSIGVILDGVVDWNIYSESDSNLQTNYSSGLGIRGFEIIVSSSVDPYVDFYGSLLFLPEGVELHEAFLTFPSFLFSGISSRIGQFFINYNRLNSIHPHALPFVSEPRPYRELFGGSMWSRGMETSWLLPLPFFLETTFGVYDRLSGDAHDTDPIGIEISDEFTIDDFAEQEGLVNKHSEGTSAHWHDTLNNDNIVRYSEVVQRAKDQGVIISGNIPLPIEKITSWENLVYNFRLQSAVDLGQDISLDIGGNVLYGPAYFQSLERADSINNIYDYLIYGGFLTVFYRPLGSSLIKNATLGLEWIGHRTSKSI